MDLLGVCGELIIIALIAVLVLKPKDANTIIKFVLRLFQYVNSCKNFLLDFASQYTEIEDDLTNGEDIDYIEALEENFLVPKKDNKKYKNKPTRNKKI